MGVLRLKCTEVKFDWGSPTLQLGAHGSLGVPIWETEGIGLKEGKERVKERGRYSQKRCMDVFVCLSWFVQQIITSTECVVRNNEPLYTLSLHNSGKTSAATLMRRPIANK